MEFASRNQPALVCGAASCCCCFLFFLLGFASISNLEMALARNNFWHTIDTDIISEPGWRYVGPYTSLLRYPKTIKSIEYKGYEMIDGRTNDGLPIKLGITFQYQLMPSDLLKLYLTFENKHGDYEQVFKTIGAHLITEIATNYTAYTFFNNKQGIASVMRTEMNSYYMAHLFSSIVTLQINEDDLPESFTDAVMNGATMKQAITVKEMFRESQKVVFSTAQVVAHGQAKVTINDAVGQVARINHTGIADVGIIDTYVQAEKECYGNISESVTLTGQKLIDYIWFDSMQGGHVDATTDGGKQTQLYIGVSPSAYVES